MILQHSVAELTHPACCSAGCWQCGGHAGRRRPMPVCCKLPFTVHGCNAVPVQAAGITGATLVDADLCQFGACEDGNLVQLVAQGELNR